MTITERLELIRAGYTKEEIAAFDTPAQELQKQTDPEPPKQDNSEVLNAINNLTKAIQLSNMQQIGLNTPGGMTAEEALAEGVFGNKIGGKN